MEDYGDEDADLDDYDDEEDTEESDSDTDPVIGTGHISFTDHRGQKAHKPEFPPVHLKPSTSTKKTKKDKKSKKDKKKKKRNSETAEDSIKMPEISEELEHHEAVEPPMEPK